MTVKKNTSIEASHTVKDHKNTHLEVITEGQSLVPSSERPKQAVRDTV